MCVFFINKRRMEKIAEDNTATYHSARNLVAVLLMLTIGYCMLLNKRLKRLKADEHSLKATIGELITDAVVRARLSRETRRPERGSGRPRARCRAALRSRRPAPNRQRPGAT